MGRILGIDYGRKRTGLAITDPLQIFAFPMETIKTSVIEAFLENYLKTEQVDAFVIGYPVMMNNMPSEAVKYIDPFIKKLERSFPGKTVHRIDERFTSGMAFQAMIDGGVSKKQRQDKSMVDKISAAIILQSYLDRKSKMGDKSGS